MLRRKETWIDILLCALGIIGTMGCFLQMYPLEINMSMVVLIMSITSAVFFYLYSNERRAKKWLKWIVIGYVLVVVLMFTSCKDGISYIMNRMFMVYESNSQYTFQRFPVAREIANQPNVIYLCIWLIFTPMCGILIRSIRLQHSFVLGFIVTIPFLFSILLFTLKPDPWFNAMLLIFYFALAGMGTSGHYKVRVHRYALQKMGLLFACSGLAFILVITNLFPEQSYIRSAKVEDFRLAIQVKIREFIVGTKEDVQGELDLASAGNRFYIGSDQLKVEMQDPQTLYLHGYSASIYKDNKWTNSDIKEGQNYASSLNFALLYEDKINAQSMTLTYLDEPQNYLYTPYGLIDNIQNDFDVIQDHYVGILDKDKNDYTLRFSNIDEVNRENLIAQRQQETYYEAIKATNLQVPNAIANTLQGIKIEGLNAAQNDGEKIDLIRSFMQDFGEYTLSPGTTPEGEDFIRYFLEKNERGYCVHYASAATMLLRYYGIPARYASGYRIDKSSFKDGVSIAEDYQQHAWVEVFDPLFGWVPVEVTPTSNGSSSSGNPNQGAITNNNPNNTTNSPNQGEDTPTQDNATKPDTTTTKDSSTSMFMVWGGLLAGILLLSLIFPIRRQRLIHKRQNAMRQSDYKQAILACDEYLELLQVHNIKDEIWEILEEARYSNHLMSKAQSEKIFAYCEEMKQQHIAQSTQKIRLYERYIKGYY